MPIKTIVINHIAKFSNIENTGVFVAETKANYKGSDRLLDVHDLRSVTHNEILKEVIKTPELKERLLGKGGFYLKDKNTLEAGLYTVNEDGTLTSGKGDVENTALVWNKIIGDVPLMLRVENDNNANTNRARYTMRAVYDQSTVAQLVVGIKTDTEVISLKRE